MEHESKPQSQSSLGLLGIFRESFKTTSRNRKLLVPIILLVFIPISQLDLAQKYLLTPIGENLELHLARNPHTCNDLNNNINRSSCRGFLDDILGYLFVKVMFLAYSSIILLVFFVATVSSSYEAYNAKMNEVLTTSYDLSWSTQLIITISFTNGLNSLLTLFMFVLFTVFYHERKTSHDEKEVKGLYIPIAAGEA
ncbi:hypothetical protein L6452_26868 [Arctium lappa]|uniref:Uncharacterized protein n=1 Tax=Arctium lappa TaxID=4217 RepID=A0ACB8ZVG6_ARCLA|nr:hypothetical protein L6452_26868 [Arctium lappa]